MNIDVTKIRYLIKVATKEQIYAHLMACNDNYIPPLAARVDISGYAKKIFEKSVTFEAWVDGLLAGLLAVYFNDVENKVGYITNISLIKDFTRKGIASELIKKCIEYAWQYGFNEIRLEVHKDNSAAIHLYRKFGFVDFESKDGLILMIINRLKCVK